MLFYTSLKMLSCRFDSGKLNKFKKIRFKVQQSIQKTSSNKSSVNGESPNARIHLTDVIIHSPLHPGAILHFVLENKAKWLHTEARLKSYQRIRCSNTITCPAVKLLHAYVMCLEWNQVWKKNKHWGSRN